MILVTMLVFGAFWALHSGSIAAGVAFGILVGAPAGAMINYANM